MTDLKPQDQTKYDAYASCLGRALCYIKTPATVGLYAPWGSQINCLLRKIQGYMLEESAAREEKESKRTQEKLRSSTGLGFITLLWYLVFLQPQLTERHQRRKNVRFIFVQFSAWEFAGSDKIWAGLITTLCENIRNKFGNLPTGIVRALSHETTIQHSVLDQEWVSKRILKIHLWVLSFLLLALGVVLTVIVIMYGFPVGDHGDTKVVAAETFGVGLVGFSALFAFKNSFMVAKNVMVSQKDTVNSLMNKTNYSAQLGFMSDVKNEVKVLTNFIRYMEIFERRKIRIILKIVNLDRCTPDKVVGVLDAMNILLSDPEAPFISILAVDPSIIATCVENSSTLKGVADNGYKYLSRTVTLPFSVPKMDTQTKLSTLQQIIDRKSDLLEETSSAHSGKMAAGRKGTTEESTPLVNVVAEEPRISPTALTKLTFQLLVQNKDLHELIEENYLQMSRIVNTIPIMMRLMFTMGFEVKEVTPDKVAAWVILASHWPCRLSWIWQCLEDRQQKMDINKEGNIDETILLWSLYDNSHDELSRINADISKLLELDGDPELFQKLLATSYKFTIRDANHLLPYTINLDLSLKRKMELLRGNQSIKAPKKPTVVKPQNLPQVLDLSVDDVCKLMKDIDLNPEKLELYKSKIRLNNLNGNALVYSKTNEIREALDMSLGDWASFNAFFLQSQPPPTASFPPQNPTYQSHNLLSHQMGTAQNLQSQQFSIAV
eukprot:gi/632988097/ref/XP_007882920.1/ PREDICTED: NTPase KAP family P-loop domain-containing protein 1-like [Callorhinchus milii]